MMVSPVYEQFDSTTHDLYSIRKKVVFSLVYPTSIDRIESEKLVFQSLKDGLSKDPNFKGKYVAVLNANIVDSDSNKISLLKKIYQKYGSVPVLIEKIDNEELEFTTSPDF